MFHGLHSPGRVKPATGQIRYGLKDKVHRKVIYGMSGTDTEDYYGPLQPGQTWSVYQAFMHSPLVVAISSLLSGIFGGSKRHMNKPKIQGG